MDKHTLAQWGREMWRKPDVYNKQDLHAIWYGPGGVEDEYATEVMPTDRGEIKVSEYTHLSAYVEEMPEEGEFLKITTTFGISELLDVLKKYRLPRPQSDLDMLRWAVGLGVANIAYWGGKESYAKELPTLENPGFDGLEERILVKRELTQDKTEVRKRCQELCEQGQELQLRNIGRIVQSKAKCIESCLEHHMRDRGPVLNIKKRIEESQYNLQGLPARSGKCHLVCEVNRDWRRGAITTSEKDELTRAIQRAPSESQARKIIADHRRHRS